MLDVEDSEQISRWLNYLTKDAKVGFYDFYYPIEAYIDARRKELEDGLHSDTSLIHRLDEIRMIKRFFVNHRQMFGQELENTFVEIEEKNKDGE